MKSLRVVGVLVAVAVSLLAPADMVIACCNA